MLVLLRHQESSRRTEGLFTASSWAPGLPALTPATHTGHVIVRAAVGVGDVVAPVADRDIVKSGAD